MPKKRQILLLCSILFAIHTSVLAQSHEIDQVKKRNIAYAQEGEDATSGFCYFFYSRNSGEPIEKVRMLWNGGSGGQAPHVRDYYIEGSSIHIVDREVEAQSLPIFLKGGDGVSRPLREKFFKSKEGEALLASPASASSYREERSHWSELISILTMARKPLTGSCMR